jgi:transcriptional regulator with XRE-family HTH domain
MTTAVVYPAAVVGASGAMLSPWINRPHSGFGTYLCRLRRSRGLSQTALAGLVGRSESWLSQVERGLRPVDRLSVLAELARVLRVDLATLLAAQGASR